VDTLARLPDETVIDGEIVVLYSRRRLLKRNHDT
jgi:hypothetical protein